MFPYHSGINILDATLDDFRHSAWLAQLKYDQASGRVRQECLDCVSRDEESDKAGRNHPMASRPLGGLARLSIWLGNLCNSECSMCTGFWSSKIEVRLKNMPLVGIDIRDDHWLDNSKIPAIKGGHAEWWKDPVGRSRLLELAKQTEEIRLLGGEPFLLKGIWEIVDVIYEANPNVFLAINTNGSVVNDDHIKSLSRFPNAAIQLSCDGVGKTYEWIRYGLDWNTLNSNIPKLKAITPKVRLVASLSAHNFMDIENLDAYADEIGLDISWFTVTRPWIVDICNLPEKLLRERKDQLKSRINDYDGPKKARSLRQYLTVERALTRLDKANTAQLIAYTERLNSFRSTKFCTDSWKVVDE